MLTRSMSSFYIHMYCSVITLVAIIVVYNIINVLLHGQSMAARKETDKNRPRTTKLQRKHRRFAQEYTEPHLCEANIQSTDCKDWNHITEVIRKDPDPIRSDRWTHWTRVHLLSDDAQLMRHSLHLRGFTDGSTEGRGL